eukprot:TRINITY_DN338_c0_g1_i1.p1 TRINITY_DN338_c0_g1~~TRINITY_DN338_c0_g1_i1.p1  ORF type:complete len:494 (+),score=167.11 TRINITY_DN338_c0_g1_i1:105-1484(+)
MSGDDEGPRVDLPIDTTQYQLESLLNSLMESEESNAFAFYVDDETITEDANLQAVVEKQKVSTESVITVKFEPLANFKVHPVTRCTDSMPGHTEAILHCTFSPNGRVLATGGGDATVRFWDVMTATPLFTCKGHRHHVLATAWSPDGKMFISGDKSGEIRLWDPKTGRPLGKPLKKHSQWITSLAWEPLHINKTCSRFVSGSKDGNVIIWNALNRKHVYTFTGHTSSVESVVWGAFGLIYSASRDRTIRVWAAKDMKLVRELKGHAHRVNHLCLNTEHLCRVGAFDYKKRIFESTDEAYAIACEKFEEFKRNNGSEKLISCSDDFTIYLWDPVNDKKPVARLIGHQQIVNHVSFSPDGRYIASAGFDKKIKLWNGRTGKFIRTLTGHVGAVYRVCWSADSRLIASASKDATCKLWNTKERKALNTLPGHFDEVYALDWSLDGERVASAGKDRLVKIWRN